MAEAEPHQSVRILSRTRACVAAVRNEPSACMTLAVQSPVLVQNGLTAERQLLNGNC